LGATSAAICLFFDLFSVIRAILAMRCLIQFVGQACGLILLHKKWKAERWPFRMWLYPAPVLLAIAGWIGIFLSTGRVPIVSSLVAMTVGVLVYLGRARMLGQWPFEQTATAGEHKEII
jgi:fructoselysine transporter